MSSIPNSAMPHAIERSTEEKAPRRSTASRLLRIAAVPPLVALGAGLMAFSALRKMASELGRKVEASGGSDASVDAQAGLPVG